MWEFTSGVIPFHDREFDFELSLSICTGERPEIIENTPQCFIDLMKKCWDTDPNKRPNASKVKNIIMNWHDNFLRYHADDDQIEEIDEKLKNDIMEFQKADEIPTTYKTNKSIVEPTFISRYEPKKSSCLFF